MAGGQQSTVLRQFVRDLGSAFHPGDIRLVGLVGMVALVGTLAAFAVRFFEHAVEWLFALGYHRLPEVFTHLGMPQWVALLVYPFLIGLVVAAVKHLTPRPDRHHSVPLVILSLAKRDGRLNPISTVLKTLGSVLTLGAGGSLGREGPVVLLGGGIGSAVGQLVRLRADWLNILVAAGAAAAIATTFHAPITGALFVMEIVLIQFSARSFALVALGSVVAAAVSEYLVGAPPFPIPAYPIENPWEIALFLGLGLVIAPLSRIYIAILYGSEEMGKSIKRVPTWLKPALGGILFGAVGLLIPETLGTGYAAISQAFTGSLPVLLLAGLLVAKLVTIGLTSGSGWVGGVFTPALFLGSMAGGLYGQIAARVVPWLAPNPGAYAVVGMAAMIAGATQAPLTAITLVFEVTRDYRIALPAMLACGVAAVLSQRISPYSVDTLHLPEHGVLLPWQVHDLRSLRVDEIMAREVHTVRTEMSLKDVIEVMQRSRHGGYPVLEADGRLVGMVTLRDVREVPLERRLSTPVTAVMATRLITLTPDQTLADAAILMAKHGIGRLPVVDPAEPGRMLGIVSRSDILRAYPTEEGRER